MRTGMLCLAVFILAVRMMPAPATAVENIRVAERLHQGDSIGAFRVTKVGGAIDDGVETGEDLCYRCRYGSRPMVLIFARKSGPGLKRLAERVDAAINANQDAHLRGLMTFIGDEPAELTATATEFVSECPVRMLPVAVAEEAMTGPVDYRIPADAPVTVIIANDSQVVQTAVFPIEEVDSDAVMEAVTAILP